MMPDTKWPSQRFSDVEIIRLTVRKDKFEIASPFCFGFHASYLLNIFSDCKLRISRTKTKPQTYTMVDIDDAGKHEFSIRTNQKSKLNICERLSLYRACYLEGYKLIYGVYELKLVECFCLEMQEDFHSILEICDVERLRFQECHIIYE